MKPVMPSSSSSLASSNSIEGRKEFSTLVRRISYLQPGRSSHEVKP